MTATITPRDGVPNLVRSNPRVRLNDYEEALKFYIGHVGEDVDGIVFVENSNSDVSSLRQIAADLGVSDRIEFVVFYGLDYPPSYDRGYGEFKLMDYAMQNSHFVRSNCDSDPETIIWKVTGRYLIRNLSEIIATRPKEFDLYCNCRNIPERLTDTYLMGWTKRGYDACIMDSYHHLKITPEIPPGVVPEKLYRAYLDGVSNRARVVKRLKFTPIVDGVRAGDNKNYIKDLPWKYRIRAAMRRAAPWVWI
jgi:hypothetical protein